MDQPTTERPCEGCGAMFAPHRNYHRYCSKGCRRPLAKPVRAASGFDSHDSPAAAPEVKWVPSEHASGRRYLRRSDPGHPLADVNGTVAVHRWVLHEKLGPGEHLCHWCGAPVRWMQGMAPVALIADHVDGNSHNNDPANLVQSCPRCNALRNGHPNSRKTHCPQGHEYDSANTYITPSTGDRLCRECIRTRNREAMRRKRAEARGG